jgi:hypothetical protein
VAAGVDLPTAQHRLGQATARLVLELYARAASEADRTAADLLGASSFGNSDALDARRAPWNLPAEARITSCDAVDLHFRESRRRDSNPWPAHYE